MSNSGQQRILVIRRRYIGDLVLTTPLFANIKRHWPSAETAALVDDGYQDILRLCPDVDRVLTIPRKGSRQLQRNLSLVRTLRREKFTHVFDLDTNDRTAFLTRITGARFRASYLSDKHRLRRSLAYTHVRQVSVEEYNRLPSFEYYQILLPLAGIPITVHACSLVPAGEESRSAETVFAGVPRGKRVLLHPGSRSSYRVWPLDRFARVIDRLQGELGVQVFLTGGPAESVLIDGIQAAAKSPLIVLPQPVSITQFAAHAGAADVFLCHDSGPMHIAAAVGTRVVALFGSQNSIVWGPAGPGHHILQAPLPCGAACVAPDECEPNNGYKSYCVRRISEEAVFSAVRETLSSLGQYRSLQ